MTTKTLLKWVLEAKSFEERVEHSSHALDVTRPTGTGLRDYALAEHLYKTVKVNLLTDWFKDRRKF
jgi:hypothetical protein